MGKYIEYDKGLTHNGKAHADDIFSAALLKILNPEIKIERAAEVPADYKGIVFDIGFGEFDHHQVMNEERLNGIPFASFGKLWRKFGPKLICPRGVGSIDEMLVQQIDASDNGKGTNLMSIMFAQMNPSWDEEDETNNAWFDQSVEIAKTILLYLICLEKNRIDGKIEKFCLTEEINKEVNRLFGNAILKVMCENKKGKDYIAEMTKYLKIEMNRKKVFDDDGNVISAMTSLWDEFGTIITYEQVVGPLKRAFFKPIDDVIAKNRENDALIYVFSYIKKYSDGFKKYADMVIEKWFLNQIRNAEDKVGIRDILIKYIQDTEDDEIIVLDKYYPWRSILINSLAKFVVYPSVRGGYNMYTVPKSSSDNTPRLCFPYTWMLSDIDDIKKALPEITFCHKNGFFIICDTIEGCRKAAILANDAYVKSELDKFERTVISNTIEKDKITINDMEYQLDILTENRENKELEKLINKLDHLYFKKQIDKDKIKYIKKYLKTKIGRQNFHARKSQSLDDILGIK